MMISSLFLTQRKIFWAAVFFSESLWFVQDALFTSRSFYPWNTLFPPWFCLLCLKQSSVRHPSCSHEAGAAPTMWRNFRIFPPPYKEKKHLIKRKTKNKIFFTQIQTHTQTHTHTHIHTHTHWGSKYLTIKALALDESHFIFKKD